MTETDPHPSNDRPDALAQTDLSGLSDLSNVSPAPALAPLPDTPPGRYRHYKGGAYEVIGAARHSETLEPLVIYRPLYNASGWWLRPHPMFFGDVVIDGVARPRFVKTASAEEPQDALEPQMSQMSQMPQSPQLP